MTMHDHNFPTLRDWLLQPGNELYRLDHQERIDLIEAAGDWLVFNPPDEVAALLPLGSFRRFGQSDEVLLASNHEVFWEQAPEESKHETVEVWQRGHYSPSTVYIAHPNDPMIQYAAGCYASLADYPVLNDEHFSEAEQAEADEIWRVCYSESERLTCIRARREEFEFADFADLMSCVRGHYFAGNPGTILC